ncbi:oxidative stress defense protein [Vibrio sp. 10N.286.49.C2]|uniref:oxidative stress defense protein n=1 Tax=unclassified Vibrio TaxID=2614977 RepID=UPI000C82DC86|nr:MULTISPECIES: oxidative stress defense protein [unclassified Vibrio]PMH29439.1 oxidative stress defense protein [Vibrio sp. 10N.286.49.C2]PMH55954.1 oxidative stress defense protein [Vibrio sp. 10N.286.49.B1]PMH81089.1 oxidative stress defense protein [Vibrio sp. 10N.286.48.B7]
MKSTLTVCALAASLVTLPSFASQMTFPHITTTGYGQVEATPDMAEFSVKVVQSQLNADQAKEDVDSVVDTFLAKLADAGVSKEDIKSSNLYLTPQYQYPDKSQPELVGYRASRTVTVQVMEIEKLNDYLDTALASGINQVDNIRLKVKDESQYQEKARIAAIQDAQQKAQSLAKGFAQQLGQVWQITYKQPQNQPVVMRSMMMDSKSESNSYQDSVITIRDRVDVVYKMSK